MEMTKTLPKQSQYIAGLDSLRGVAIIFVVLYHMFPDVIKGGFLGVSLFFVLSGYLIAKTSQTAWEQHRFKLFGFYQKRMVRIYPALLLTICGTVILLNKFIPPAMCGIQNEIYSILGGYNNWWQISQNASYFTKLDGFSPFTHLWFLAIELQYYLIWPLLLWICIRLKHKKGNGFAGGFLLILALVSIFRMIFLYQPGEDPSRVYYGTDTRVFSLLLGSALGFCQKTERSRPFRGNKRYLWLLLIAFLIMGILFFTTDGQDERTYQLLLPLSSLLFGGMIYLLSLPELSYGRWLDRTPLSWIGKCSYEIYLCQYPINFLFQLWKRGRNPYSMIVLELLFVASISIWMHYFSSIIKKPSNHMQINVRQNVGVEK